MNAPVLGRNLLLLRDLEEALVALDGLSPLALKGAVFATQLYLSPGLRPMEDLDLWVPEAHMDEARRRLAGLGYSPEPGNPTNLRRGTTALDLESSFWYLTREQTAELWNRAVTLPSQSRGIPTVPWEDHFVFVMAHSAAHHGWWDEQHAEDLRLLLELPLDWELAARRLREARLGPAAAASFDLLGLLPPEPLARLAVSLSERLEARAYETILRRAQLPAIGHMLRFWSSAEKLSFLGRSIFPGDEFLERRYGSRPGLYRWLRPGLLASSLLRSLALTAWTSVMGERSPAPGRVERALEG